MHHALGTLVSSVAALVAAASPRAQEKAAAPLAFDVKIVCEAWGEPQPRDTEREDGAVVLVGHRVRWEVGPKRFRSPDALRAELKRLESDPTKKGLIAVIQPGPEVCLADVVVTVDSVREAGFEDVRFERLRLDVDLRRIEPSEGDAPDLIPPASKTAAAEPDPAWSAEVTIRQGGQVVLEGAVAYDPSKGPSMDEAGRVLRFELLREARGRGLVRFDRTAEPPREVVTAPLLIRADKWTEWHYVGKLLEPCSARGAPFSKVRLGVTEKDVEADWVRRRRIGGCLRTCAFGMG